MFLKLIYKITYPNGKIYIGKDLTGTFRYFGSPNSKLLESDFTNDEKRDFTIRREISWQCNDATDREANKKESELTNQIILRFVTTGCQNSKKKV